MSRTSRSGALRDLIEVKLADSDLAPAAREIVLKAFPASSARPSQTVPEPTYLKSVTVCGFRGIGAETRLDIAPGPGLTVITGANGTGKSSFAEALELAFTGENARWTEAKRAKTVQDDWRNLHFPSEKQPKISVEYISASDAKSRCVRRYWNGDEVKDAVTLVSAPDEDDHRLEEIDWGVALTPYRPFLSYSELGTSVAGRPTDMYKSVAAVLGLQGIIDAQQNLLAQEKDLKQVDTAAKEELAGLRTELSALDDSRAREVVKVLNERSPSTSRLRALLETHRLPEGTDHARLRALANLHGPDTQRTATVLADLRSAVKESATVSGTSADTALKRSDLLARVVELHRSIPEDHDCPVCGTGDQLTDAWVIDCEQQIRELRREGEHVKEVQRKVTESVQAAHRLIEDPPAWLPEQVTPAWEAWLNCRSHQQPESLIEAIEASAAPLRDACDPIRAAAAAELSVANEQWSNATSRVRTWVCKAEKATKCRQELKQLQEARAWLKEVHNELRTDRLRPLEKGVKRNWQKLCMDSSVELAAVALTGEGTRRKLALDLAVDGRETTALGVVSQGELNALALSLFLPRATTDESPFRFIVLDDPVQSMDPVKIVKLAQILAEVAENRQVVVFTHDHRLVDSLRFQGLPVTEVRVERGRESAVLTKKRSAPATQAVNEAKALIKDANVSSYVAKTVLPGVCRSALEAAFYDLAYQALSRRGKEWKWIEEQTSKTRELKQLAGLALSEEGRLRDEDIPQSIREAFGEEALQIIDDCNHGSHEAGALSDPKTLVGRVEKLVNQIGKHQ